MTTLTVAVIPDVDVLQILKRIHGLAPRRNVNEHIVHLRPDLGSDVPPSKEASPAGQLAEDMVPYRPRAELVREHQGLEQLLLLLPPRRDSLAERDFGGERGAERRPELVLCQQLQRRAELRERRLKVHCQRTRRAEVERPEEEPHVVGRVVYPQGEGGDGCDVGKAGDEGAEDEAGEVRGGGGRRSTHLADHRCEYCTLKPTPSEHSTRTFPSSSKSSWSLYASAVGAGGVGVAVAVVAAPASLAVVAGRSANPAVQAGYCRLAMLWSSYSNHKVNFQKCRGDTVRRRVRVSAAYVPAERLAPHGLCALGLGQSDVAWVGVERRVAHGVMSTYSL